MTPQLEDLDIGASIDRRVVSIEASPRWVRAFLGGTPIADSKRVLLVFEPRRLPVYYFSVDDVRMDLMRPGTDVGGASESAPARLHWTLEFGNRVVKDVAWSLVEIDDAHRALKNHIAFYWARMDAWFEEDEQVFVHARDPHKRVDVLPSSRHVVVMVDGHVIADTTRPHLLFETGLPTRYYIPRTDVRLDLLELRETTTQCPYKGRASYWSVRIGDARYADLVWSYPFPIPECPKIAQLMAFFNERVDIYVDGELQPRPNTPWRV